MQLIAELVELKSQLRLSGLERDGIRKFRDRNGGLGGDDHPSSFVGYIDRQSNCKARVD
jgi:hypothetical protein